MSRNLAVLAATLLLTSACGGATGTGSLSSPPSAASTAARAMKAVTAQELVAVLGSHGLRVESVTERAGEETPGSYTIKGSCDEIVVRPVEGHASDHVSVLVCASGIDPGWVLAPFDDPPQFGADGVAWIPSKYLIPKFVARYGKNVYVRAWNDDYTPVRTATFTAVLVALGSALQINPSTA